QRVVHGCEHTGVALHIIAETLTRFVLGQADRTDRRMTEDHRRNVRVIQLAILHAAEEPIRKATAGSNGHWRQLGTASDIANGEDGIDIRLLPFVDDDMAAFVRAHATGFKTKLPDVRFPAG